MAHRRDGRPPARPVRMEPDSEFPATAISAADRGWDGDGVVHGCNAQSCCCCGSTGLQANIRWEWPRSYHSDVALRCTWFLHCVVAAALLLDIRAHSSGDPLVFLSGAATLAELSAVLTCQEGQHVYESYPAIPFLFQILLRSLRRLPQV